VTSDQCSGAVGWRADGGQRCEQHQRCYERTKRKQALLSWGVAALIVATFAVVVNALIGPESGPSQARAWEVCHESAAATLDIGPGARFAELPSHPSERVKVRLTTDLYSVFSYYEMPDMSRREFVCTVRYLGKDDWQMVDLTVAP
jgi:hypothetical protein